ncbi:MAG: DUF4314 domain-containing protein [Oscillospiraceae bacterium]|nr:DUF4314 domain-containing protein [Oscillospiraceae bacterium]
MIRGRVEFYKEHYPAGTRICLDSMGDDPRPVPAGTKGTVVAVDDMGTVGGSSQADGYRRIEKIRGKSEILCTFIPTTSKQRPCCSCGG